MKVVILHPPLYPMNHDLFNILGKKINLTVYSFGEHPRLHTNWSVYEYQKKAKNYKIKVFGKGAMSIKTQLNFSAILEIYKDNPDIVISIAFWIPSLYASILKKVFGFKFFIVTDAIFETEKNISKTKTLIRNFICNNTDLIISASELTTQYLKDIFPKTNIKMSIQTIDLKTWNEKLNSLPDKKELRKELNLPLDKNIFLGVGNFIDKKNWETVFQQMKTLEGSIFILIGSGKLESKFKELIDNDILRSKILILPRKDGIELTKYFKLSDAFIFPSLYDQFGYVVCEALASGLPVLCSSRSGASSLIKDGYNGFVVDPTIKFESELKQIIINKDLMSKNSYSSINKNTLENKANEYLEIIKEDKL